jgi:hypothetical protein
MLENLVYGLIGGLLAYGFAGFFDYKIKGLSYKYYAEKLHWLSYELRTSPVFRHANFWPIWCHLQAWFIFTILALIDARFLFGIPLFHLEDTGYYATKWFYEKEFIPLKLPWLGMIGKIKIPLLMKTTRLGFYLLLLVEFAVMALIALVVGG